MSGGIDADIFRFFDGDLGVGTGRDHIKDFDPAAGDRIDLSPMDANALGGGNQAFTFLGVAYGNSAFTAPGQVWLLVLDFYENPLPTPAPNSIWRYLVQVNTDGDSAPEGEISGLNRYSGTVDQGWFIH